MDFGAVSRHIVIGVLSPKSLVAIGFILMIGYLRSRKQMVLVLAELLLLDLLHGLRRVLRECAAAVNALELGLGGQLLRLVVGRL